MNKYEEQFDKFNRTETAATPAVTAPTQKKLKYEDQFDAAEEPVIDNTSAAGRGFETSFRQIPELLYGLVFGASKAKEDLTGKSTSLESSVKKYALEKYVESAKEVGALSKPTDQANYAYDRAINHGEYGALVKFFEYSIGYGAGQALQSLATAGVGNLVAKAAAKKVVKETVDSMVSKEVEKLAAQDASKGVAKEALTQTAVKNVAQNIGRIGETAALAGQSLAMEGGEIFGERAHKAQQEGKILSGKDVAEMVGWSLLSGATELVGNKFGVDLVLGRKTAAVAAKATGLGGRAARAATQGALGTVVEGGTEFVQTLMEEKGKGHDPLSRESIIAAINAAAQGAVGGAGMGIVGGALTGPADTAQQPAPTPQPEKKGITAEQSQFLTYLDEKKARGEAWTKEETARAIEIAATVKDEPAAEGIQQPEQPAEQPAVTGAVDPAAIMGTLQKEQNFQGTPEQIAQQEQQAAFEQQQQPPVAEAKPTPAPQEMPTEQQGLPFEDQAVQPEPVGAEQGPTKEEEAAFDAEQEPPTEPMETVDLPPQGEEPIVEPEPATTEEQAITEVLPPAETLAENYEMEEPSSTYEEPVSKGQSIMDRIADKGVVDQVEQEAQPVGTPQQDIVSRIPPIQDATQAKDSIRTIEREMAAQREIQEPATVAEPEKPTIQPEATVEKTETTALPAEITEPIRRMEETIVPKAETIDPSVPKQVTELVAEPTTRKVDPVEITKAKTLDQAIKIADIAVDGGEIPKETATKDLVTPPAGGVLVKPAQLGLFEQAQIGSEKITGAIIPEVKKQRLLSVREFYNTNIIPQITANLPKMFSWEIGQGIARMDDSGTKLMVGRGDQKKELKLLDYDAIAQSRLGTDGFEAASFISAGFKKIPIVFDGNFGADGFFNRAPENKDYIFVSSNTAFHPVAVVAHELFHATPELKSAVFDLMDQQGMMKRGAETVARLRHDRRDASGKVIYKQSPQLLKEEVGADLIGHAFQDVEGFWPKVFKHLDGQYGAPKAKDHVLGFVEKLRTYVVDLKTRFTNSTFLSHRGEVIAHDYVNSVEAFYEKLAPIVAKHYNKLPASVTTTGLKGAIESTSKQKLAAPELKATTARHFVPTQGKEGALFIAKRDLPVLIKNTEYPHSIIPRGAKLAEHVLKATGYQVPTIKSEPEIGSEEEFKSYVQRVDKFASDTSLPEYARQAIFQTERVRRTNYKKDAHLTDATWVRETVPVMSLRDANPDLIIPGRFQGTYRGSMTKGPIVLDHEGNVIDGVNRTLEAARSGKKTIEVYRPIRKKTPNTLASPEGDTVQNVQNNQVLESTNSEETSNTLAPRESGVDPVVLITEADTAGAQKRVNTLLAMVRNYPTVTGKGTNLQLLEKLHDTMVSNLIWLHNQVQPEMRERAKQWYDGAHRMTKAWATMYGVSHEQAAAVMAVTSPQMDWFSNVTIAERILHIMKHRQHERVTPAMVEWARSYANLPIQDIAREELLLDMKRLEKAGTALGEMNNPDAARFIRVFDETYHDRSYKIVSPEGGYTDFARTAVESETDLFGSVIGDKLAKRWSSFNPIEKSVEILRSDVVKLSMIGKSDKVVNFYRNIIEPNSATHEVTIDTHAVAATFVRALSGKSKEVADAWSRAGMYEVYRRAYQDAAFQMKILPREMQSITWEAVRALFPASIKSGISEQVDEQWKLYRKGKQNLNQTRNNIFKLSGGIKKFMWEDGGIGFFPEQGATSFDTTIAEKVEQRKAYTIQHGFSTQTHPVDPETQTLFSPSETPKIRLDHYSRVEGLEEIKPNYQGTGRPGAEQRRQQNAEPGTYIARTYYYRTGAKPEARFKGDYKYHVEINEGSLFDMAGYPGDPTEAEKYAFDTGYEGAYNSEGAMPEAVILFKKQTVVKGPTVEEIHELADQKGIAWDNNPAFMEMTKEVTGKKHLDRLNADQRQKLFTHIQGMETQYSQVPESQDNIVFSPAPQITTKEFQDWFLKSKVTKYGKPLIVYHGTNSSDLHSLYFSDNPMNAETYAGSGAVEYHSEWGDIAPNSFQEEAATGANLVPAYLSLQHPLVIDAKGAFFSKIIFPESLTTLANTGSIEEAVYYAKQKDYDGVIVRNVIDTRGAFNQPQTTFVAFTKNQVKSAIGNNGDFSANNSNLLFSPAEFALTQKEKDANKRKFLLDSKVKHGVYHTTRKNFSSFKRMGEIGVHFGTAGQALNRFEFLEKSNPIISEYSEDAPRTLKAYISLKRPLRMKDQGQWTAQTMRDALETKFKDDAKKIATLRTNTDVRQFLQSKGYDGIVYKNTYEVNGLEEYRQEKDEAFDHWQENKSHILGKPSYAELQAEQAYNEAYNDFNEFRNANAEDSYIVFDPTQIKSATGNIGTYDNRNSDIRYSPTDEPVVVNIGMDVNDGSKLSKEEILAALARAGVSVLESSVQKSDTELTVVATLDRPLTADEANTVSTELKQDAISQRVGTTGALYGPQAEKWGPFDPGRFLGPATEGTQTYAPSKTNPNFPQPVNYNIGVPTRLDYYVRLLQDKNIDVSRMVDAIKNAGGVVPTEANPVLREEMYHKLVEQMDTDFENDELKPLLELMRVNKVTMEQLNDYMLARHIVLDDLNAKLDSMNPKHPQAGQLAGQTDAWAQNVIANTNLRTMLPLIRRVDAITRKTRQMMVGYGLESQKTIDKWEQTYQAYVPLRREGFDEEGYGTGTGRSVRGSTVQGRLGSGKEVSHILANIAQARSAVIGRGEKMKPVKAMAALLMMHPNADIGTLARPAPVTVTNPLTGLEETVPGDITLANGGLYKVPLIKTLGKDGKVHHIVDPQYKGRDNVVNFRVEGKDYSIVFNEENERAMEMAKAFKNLDAPKLSGIMAAVAPFTRYLASINTQYNPIFGIINFVRDVQFAMIALQSTPLSGAKSEVLSNTISALNGIYDDARAVRHGLHPTSATAQMWERFQHVGGPTGYRDIFTSVHDRAAQLNSLLNPKGWAEVRTPSEFGQKMKDSAVFSWLSDYNTTMENAVRLGVFKAAVDRGISDIEAASLAKNITVNFNKKGQIGAQAGSVYAFFNANVQGSARIAETLFEPIKTGKPIQLSSVGKKIIAGGVLVGVLQAFMLAMAGYEEDDVPEFVKQRTLILPIPGTEKGYVQIPMPLGFNVLPNIGRLAAETVISAMKSGNGKVVEHGYDLIGAIASSFIPVGGSASIIQTVLPTVLDPIAGLEANIDWTGRPIYREDLDRRNPTPGHTRMKDSATIWAQAISRAINWVTGGNEYRPGLASWSPDAIDYTIAQITGGVGREGSKLSQLVEGAIEGKAVPIYKVPIIGRFVGSASGSSAVRDRYYETIKNVNVEYNELKGRMKAGDDADVFLAEHPEARLHALTTMTENQLHKLQDRRRQLIQKDSPREEVKLVEQQITGMMKRVNDAYIERTQKK